MKFLLNSQTGDLGVGSKGQIPLNFIENVGKCDGVPSTEHSSFKIFSIS